ncbi:MAG: DnaJ domain-containing protein [Thermodesulfobacteriota bacterium]
MSKRALIIGSDRDYCYVLKEFLALRELFVTVVLDYKEGVERLFYEKPDLAVFENTSQEPIDTYRDAVEGSSEFEVVDFNSGQSIGTGIKPVLIFDDKSQINRLFDFLKASYSNPETEDSPDRGDEGSLGTTFYPSLLVDIYHKKKSGILSISSKTNLIIYFINGSPVFAEGGDIETAIGRILLDRGRIDEQTYEKALDIATKNKQKFGQILFEMGITSPHELNSFLEFQIQEKILKGFYYINGKYVFKGGDDFADRIVSYQVDLSKIIYEGVRRYIDVESLEEANPTIVADPRLKSDINNLGLKPRELRFVQLLKERSTVRDILEGSRLDRQETLKLLYFLSLFKLVKITGVSPDEIGRASIEKLTREKERAAGTGGEASVPADTESIFGEMKEAERGAGAESDSYTENEEPADHSYPGAEEEGGEPEPANERAEESAAWFGPPSGMEEADAEQVKSIESSVEPPEEESGNEPVYYPAGTEAEGVSGEEPTAGSYVHEIEIDQDEETGDDLTAEVGEAFLGLQFRDEGRFENGSPEPELELDRPSGNEPRDAVAEDGFSSLFQPYKDAMDEGEDDAGAESKVEFIFAGQSPGPAFAGETEEDSTLRPHSADFNERVAEFHSTMQQKDYYEILGVSQEASPEEVRDAYYKLVKCYHPDVNPNADQEIRAKAEEIFTQISTAYETLSERDKREQYDSHEELSVLKSQAKYIYEAEMTFKKGITLLIQRDYAEAEKKIREAVNMNPDEAAYLGALAWAGFLAAGDKSAVVEEVKSSLEKALKMNDKIPENNYYLASVYKYANDLRNAEKYFEKAIELDPDYIEAKREVRLIKTRKTSIKNDKKIEKNFWSSLFKK